MLLPTQLANSTIATGFMRSILEQMEERRAEEDEKTKPRKEDKTVKAQIKPDETAQAANAKINEHFFGALKNDENRMAALVAHFADMLGVAQGADESASEFADRLTDAMTLTNLVAKNYADGKVIPVGLGTLGVKQDDVVALMKGETSEDDKPSAMTVYAARIAVAAGIDPDDETFSDKIKEALTAFRQTLPETMEDVEKRSGLTDLGITAAELIEAIRSPQGREAQKIKAAFDEKDAAEKTMTKEMVKVLQRVEDVADPKTLEELKAERTERDPTKVEDAETRREREEDIKALEAGEKLEDVQELQDVIKEHNDQIAENGDAGGEPGDSTPVPDPTQMIQVLAAGAQAAEISEEAADDIPAQTDTDASLTVDDGDPNRMSRDEQAVLAASISPESGDPAQPAGSDVLPISVDEIGIYALLKKDRAA